MSGSGGAQQESNNRVEGKSLTMTPILEKRPGLIYSQPPKAMVNSTVSKTCSIPATVWKVRSSSCTTCLPQPRRRRAAETWSPSSTSGDAVLGNYAWGLELIEPVQFATSGAVAVPHNVVSFSNRYQTSGRAVIGHPFLSIRPTYQYKWARLQIRDNLARVGLGWA